MDPAGDQFHDTLHQTRVRQEIAENERQAFAEEAAQLLNGLYTRFEGAVAAAEAGGYESEQVFGKLQQRCAALHNDCRTHLEEILAAEGEAWYPARDKFDTCRTELEDAVRVLESLGTP